MDAALPPLDDDGGDVVADKILQSRTFKDEEHCAVGAPLPQNGGDEAGGGADKPSRSRTTRARLVLALGLLLEVSATAWAFQQAISAGALNGDVDCSKDGTLDKLYISSLVVDTCDGPIEAGVFYNYTDTLEESSHLSYLKEYVGCDNVTDAPTGEDSFEERCTCPEEITYSASCSWVALSSSPSDEICYAQGLSTNSSDGTVTGISSSSFYYDCWASNPTGTVELTITALVVALSSELLEAFVGFKYWRDTAKGETVFTPAASIFEALGVLAVSSVLLSLPGLYTVSDAASTDERLPVCFWLAWTIVTFAVVGALAEITAECSDRAAGRLPYLGAVGNGLIWLGAAMLEIAVTSYLLWVGAGIKNFVALLREAAGLFVLELLGLVSMWIARGLWTRAKLLRPSVKILEGPLRKSTDSAPIK